MSDESPPAMSAEDRRKHLDFIQAAVNRMAAASATTKGWLLPVVTATYGYAVTQGSRYIAFLGMAAVVLFGMLDAHYLRQERCFRRLYDAVAQGLHIPHFAMDCSQVDSDGRSDKPRNLLQKWIPPVEVLESWAIGPLYGGLLLVGFVIAAFGSNQ